MKLGPFNLGRKSGGFVPFSSASLGQLLAAAFGGGATKSGATVTVETALQVSAVLGCTRVIAEGIAQVPFHVMRKTGESGSTRRAPAVEHPLYDVLHRKPNPWQTSFGLRETMAYHAVLCGNAYAFKNHVGREQRIAQLIVLPPGRCRPDVADDGSVTYKITGRNGAQRTLQQRDVWHLRGPSWDGHVGMDALKLAREAIGLAMATEETQAQLHTKGVRSTGTYSIEGKLEPKQYEDLKAWLVKEFGGRGNAGMPMILDRGAKWLPTSMSGVDAQHLETRAYQVLEICRQMRVMPIMVGYSDKAATYASAEQMFIAHVVHTLMPWFERLEQSADCDLLTDEDRAAGHYTLLEAKGLLRGSMKDRAEYFSKALGAGGGPAWMTQDQVREEEDMNPMGGAAAALPIPTNVGGKAPAVAAPAGA